MDQSVSMAVRRIMADEGWKVVKTLLDEYEQSAVDEVMNCLSADPDVIRSRQIAARVTRDVKRLLYADLQEIVNNTASETEGAL